MELVAFKKLLLRLQLVYMGLRLGLQVLFAAILGIFIGIFFGPYCSVIEPLGDAYVMLLQMAILPYIPLSLIHGIGSLSPHMAKKLLRSGWFYILILWGLTFLVLFLLSLPIPTPEVIVVNQGPSDDQLFLSGVLNYIVPQNPFYDLANNILPALAIFGLIIGIAMMLLHDKEPLLPIVEKLILILERIFHWLAILSPIAVFTHLAMAAGTVHFEDLLKLEFYVLLVILGTLFLTFWVLPKILESVGPFSYKELLKEGGSACLIGFATGLPSIAFPFMLRSISRLMHRHRMHPTSLRSTSQTVVPLAYSFVQLGNIFLFLFIVFMGFYFRDALTTPEKALLPFLTLLLSLGASSSSISSVSFLVDYLKWPEQTVNLYMETSAITGNFQVMLSIASVMSFIILVLLSYYKLLKIHWKKLLLNIGIGFALFVVAVFSIKANVHLQDNYSDIYTKLKISESIQDPVPFKILEESDKKLILKNPSADPLSRIIQERVLRVGYDTGNIPFCYINAYNELAGYDIACAFQLAKDLDCRLEFVPIDRTKLSEELSDGIYDIAMSAILMSEDRILQMDFSYPYTEEENVLVVPRNHLNDFLNFDMVQSLSSLRIGGGGGYAIIAKRYFPNAIQTSDSTSGSTLTDLSRNEVDAIVWSKLPAFVWCLSNPEFVVLEYGPILGKRFFSYPMKWSALDWTSFVNDWLALSKESGFIDKQQNYWLKAKPYDAEKNLRWSIIRNVLHWVD